MKQQWCRAANNRFNGSFPDLFAGENPLVVSALLLAAKIRSAQGWSAPASAVFLHASSQARHEDGCKFKHVLHHLCISVLVQLQLRSYRTSRISWLPPLRLWACQVLVYQQHRQVCMCKCKRKRTLLEQYDDVSLGIAVSVCRSWTWGTTAFRAAYPQYMAHRQAW